MEVRNASLDDLLDEIHDRHMIGMYSAERLIHISGWLYELAVMAAEREGTAD